MNERDQIAVLRRVHASVLGETPVFCKDLADLAELVPQLREHRGWLMRRRHSALRVQRTSTQRVELLIALGALLEERGEILA